jgi:8-oxo-dGTP pyrophosphatase MutT (NUDIX family)
MSSTNQQPSVNPSATVLLLRDSPAGLEVFMVVRHHKIDAFSGALVFPGGKLDAADHDSRLATMCRNGPHIEPMMRAFHIAAIREAFEECGVLLARPKGTQHLIDATRLEALSSYRQALLNDEIDMAELCRTEQLELATDLLQHYAHWITPKTRPRIFDTHFFLAPAPAGQLALHDGSESLDSMWITPQRALDEAARGKLTVVFPTRMNLLKLSHCASLEQALDRARSAVVTTVQPQLETHEDGTIMTIPDHAGYDASRVFVGNDGMRFEFLN